MRTRRTTLATLVAGLTFASAPQVHALVLGEIVSVSAVGEPLRIEIRSLDGRTDEAGNCLRVSAPPDADPGLPTVGKARISAAGSGPNARVILTTGVAFHEPVAQLFIEDICNAHLRRHYNLLLSYPVAPPASAVAAPAPASAPQPERSSRSASQSRRAATASTNRWTTAPGESLDSLAAALYPDDVTAQRRFAAATAKANPALFADPAARGRELPAGTELIIPDMRRSAERPATAEASSTATGEARAPARSKAAAQREPDRLVVANDPESRQPASTARATAAANDPTWTARERELAVAVDRTIVAQMELLSRIKELEQLQAQLEARAAQLGVQLPAAAAAPAAPSAAAPEAAAPAAAPVAPAAPPAPVQSALPPAEPERDYRSLALVGGLAALALALAGVLIARRRRPAGADSAGTEDFVPTAVPAARPATPSAPRPAPAPAPTVRDELPALSLTQEPRSIAPALVLEEEVEEHDSAIELAEIMMSFGRVHGAAETLAEFIRHNPKQAVTPWLKLLEVYRAAGLRAEFDALARQLNKTFNVLAVTWENFDAARSAPASIELLPHIVANLEKLWGTRECQGYIHTLLRDNRDGTRQGFPLRIIDELLLLAAILEQHLGPYRAEPDAPPPEAGERKAA